MDNSKLSDIVRDLNVKWIAEHWSDYNEQIEKDVEAIHFTFINVPFDYAINYRPGARFGPESIITALNNCTLYCADKRVSLESAIMSHMGTIIPEHSFMKSYKRIQNEVAKVSKKVIPIFLGGDHSITDPIYRGISERSDKRVGLISFDTHFDYRVPIEGFEHSGNWLRTLEDCINYEAVALIGVSAPVYSEYYMKSMDEAGAMVVTPYDMRRMQFDELLSKIINHMNKSCDEVYITVDIDVIDQGFVTGTSAPNPNGLYPYELMNLLFELCVNLNVIGMDICEVSPHLDHYAMLSSNVAAQIIISFMSGLVKRYGNKKK